MDLAIERKLILRSSEKEDGTEEVLAYTAQSFFLELNTARMLCELNITIPQGEKGIEKKIRRVEAAEDRTLDPLQKEAVMTAAGQGLMILTGGPGTGKTTTINTMIPA